ncbi:hypothetical protein OG936_14825 [Streptomyces sp. NBC_00846]|uniref:hypothetical protein n=1 Tax=Streptomyces sp. NBC_00846 TaxID=2975849 RepID=UPI003865FFBE|nr:hypothetical protein OG936_14825 [Streptomyces sp. NBC_00846]
MLNDTLSTFKPVPVTDMHTDPEPSVDPAFPVQPVAESGWTSTACALPVKAIVLIPIAATRERAFFIERSSIFCEEGHEAKPWKIYFGQSFSGHLDLSDFWLVLRRGSVDVLPVLPIGCAARPARRCEVGEAL